MLSNIKYRVFWLLPCIALLFANISIAQVVRTEFPGRQAEVVYPVGAGDSIGGVVNAINSQLVTSFAKITEIYSWVAGHIEYDPSQQSIVETPELLNILVEDVFSSRKAICQGYCAIFNALCTRCSITSFIVHGLAKNNGIVQRIPHAWIAAYIGNKWLLFDPAWGAGKYVNGVFYPDINFNYFNIDPAISIKSRMPYDPVWQLLDNPYSVEDFVSGKKPKDQIGVYAFADSISRYLSSDQESRFVAECRRVKECGNNSILTAGYYDFLCSRLRILRMVNEVELKNETIDLNNMVVNLYNKAAISFNRYIISKSTQFSNPEYSDKKILEMISEPDSLLQQGELIMAELKSGDAEINNILHSLSVRLIDLRRVIDSEKAFITLYCNTDITKRKSLFH